MFHYRRGQQRTPQALASLNMRRLASGGRPGRAGLAKSLSPPSSAASQRTCGTAGRMSAPHQRLGRACLVFNAGMCQQYMYGHCSACLGLACLDMQGKVWRSRLQQSCQQPVGLPGRSGSRWRPQRVLSWGRAWCGTPLRGSGGRSGAHTLSLRAQAAQPLGSVCSAAPGMPVSSTAGPRQSRAAAPHSLGSPCAIRAQSSRAFRLPIAHRARSLG